MSFLSFCFAFARIPRGRGLDELVTRHTTSQSSSAPNCSFDGRGVVSVQPIQQAACDQPVDVGLADLDLVNSKTALPSVAETLHADSAR